MISRKRHQLGDVKYIDTDNNGQITADDRQFCGSPWAKMQMSLVLNAEWKDFDFSMMWNGQFGNKIYNVSKWQGRLFFAKPWGKGQFQLSSLQEGRRTLSGKSEF